uniref:CD24 n=1 Tax=Macaca mulatta TaxID=9544 RepID=A0A5F8A6W3_MACMU
ARPPRGSHWNSQPLSGLRGTFCSLGGNALAPGPAAAPPRRTGGLFFWGIYSTVTTSAPLSSNSSQNTSTTPNPANTTTKAVGGALQSTASLFVVSLSLLHLYC